MTQYKQYKCPFAQRVPLRCDIIYSFDEFLRQAKQLMDSGQEFSKFIGSKQFSCQNNPELCPRYIQHLVKNIKTYKQR